MQISFAIYSDITFIHFLYATAAFFFFMICSTAEIPTRTMPTRSVTVPGMIRQRPPMIERSRSITFRFANM